MPSSVSFQNPNPYLFFTGKGGVGKTSLSCAVALTLVDRGKRVLLVSTDPASNLDEMLGITLTDQPKLVPDTSGLFAMNIDPDKAAEDYRVRVLDQMGPQATEEDRATVREQLSGACTIEIAAFDEFVGLLSGEAAEFDHVIFDTAPTGHTLRLLSLPRAWTGFLKGNDRGASCLGPHSGLKMQEERFKQALTTLSNPAQTSIVLVTRADRGAVREAARTSDELRTLGLGNQRLVINGVFRASGRGDAIADGLARDHAAVIAALPANLAALPKEEVPLRSFDMVGLTALRALFDDEVPVQVAQAVMPAEIGGAGLDAMVDELAQAGHGLIMVMGKGGVGKTTVAAAVAVGMVKRGHKVHLTTTDPAAHVSLVVDGSLDGLVVDRIDPVAETARYIEKVMATKGRDLDEADRALMLEDLASPCTEEVAVFHAFSRIVAEARGVFVVMDTAPTGHTLLLLDATGAYHRQTTQDMGPAQGRIVTPLMRLQDPEYTKVILVALPETTPVSEAASLQDDLRRARIEPWGWVVNRSMARSGTTDPLLQRRIKGEAVQIARVRDGLARRIYLLPFLAEPPVGVPALMSLT